MQAAFFVRWPGAVALAVTLVAATGPAAAQLPTPVAAVRIALPAELRRGEEIRALRLREPLQTGDRIVTGPQGRVSLQLAGGGQLRLGGDSSLRLHSAEYPDEASGGIARLVLERGALRLDALPRPPLLPQDYRLNLGRLRLRVFGGDAWTEINARGESLCLLQGAVEIVTDEGSERVDQPGECVIFGQQGHRLQLRADTGEALARKLLRTAFADDVNARMAADRAAAPSAALPAAAEPPAPAPVDMLAPAGGAEAPTAAASAAPRLTVVLGSFPDAASAEIAAHRRRERGAVVEIRRHDTPAGARYRLIEGEYRDRREAAEALRAARREGIAEAWLMPLDP
jgi:hypothetical protein